MMGAKRALPVFLLIHCLVLVGAFLFFQQAAWAKDITLAWDSNTETNLAGYKIYYKPGASGGQKLDNYPGKGAREGDSPIIMALTQDEDPDAKVVEFTLHDLPENQILFFVVTAFNTQGLESPASREIAGDDVPPGKPSNLGSTQVPGQCSNAAAIGVSWTPPSDPEPGSGLDGYSIVWDASSDTIPDTTKDIGLVSGVTSPALSDGTYWFHIRAVDKLGYEGAGNWGETAHYGPFCIEKVYPGVAGKPTIDGTTIEITYSESGMKNAGLATNYSLDNGAIVSGVTDVTGEGSFFRLALTNFQSYIIYTMTISGNVTDIAGNPLPSSQRTIREINDADSDGMADDWEIRWFGSTTAKNGTADTDGDGMMDVREYNVARANPGWAARWDLSPLSRDSDGDGISDKYEVDYGLNPVDASDRNLDRDNDGWSNYEEYVAGYAANNANSPVPAPPQVKEVIPAGKGPIPSNSVFAVRLEATQGINITQSSGVTVTVNDGTQTYKRNLNDKNAANNEIVKAIPLGSGGTTSKNLWIAYYRSNETAMASEFSSGVTVTVTFEATDVRKDSMTPKTLTFRIQTAGEEQEEADNLPNTVTLPNTPAPGLTTIEVTNTATMLDRAAIIYDTSLPGSTGIIPYVGPTENIPVFDVSGYTGVGVEMNLLPPAVFPSGVTVVVPCPGYTNVSGLGVHYYNGQQWVMACDPAGNVQPGGVGWMVPGSRVNHNGNPSSIEIGVYHFSAVITATNSGTTVAVETGGGGGGGCFISVLGGK